MPKGLDLLQQKLSYQFSDPGLVKQALTHRSANKINNERLEFLGDSLLGFIIADALCEIHPQASEGDLSRMRANIVNKPALAEIARELDLGSFVRLGTGEIKTGGQQRDSILADAVEALIAAIYLDGGIDVCRELVRKWNRSRLRSDDVDQKQKDCKTRLQELMQAKGVALPQYDIVEISGAAHQQQFHVSCRIAGMDEPQKGSGSSKRDAEQQAAKNILAVLGESV